VVCFTPRQLYPQGKSPYKEYKKCINLSVVSRFYIDRITTVVTDLILVMYVAAYANMLLQILQDIGGNPE
jgi:hypothetical protein